MPVGFWGEPLLPSRAARNSDVVAATAGTDNWKTLAGRTEGPDSFEPLDLVRVAHRKFARRFLWRAPPAGTACPVCFEDPLARDDGDGGSEGGGGNAWHVTSACGHAVCRSCLRAYSASLVADPSHRGPLRCPCCPQLLRPKDAIVALGDDEDLLQKWDKKIRDELLRALPGYRHCPHCDNGTGGGLGVLSGGGFVTPECLAPAHTEREVRAEQILELIHWLKVLLGGLYVLYLYVYFSGGKRNQSAGRFYVDVINILLPLFSLLPPLFMACEARLAAAARRALERPIVVGCPCCSGSFILNAESELSDRISDRASEEWIGNNTRPCPSCSAPIVKADGCNHMRCTSCRAQFCWACMRLGTRCQAFRCSNGAPFGNAAVGIGEEVGGEGGGGIIARIAAIENRAEGLRPMLNRRVVTFFVMLLSIVARDTRQVQVTSKVVVTSFAFLFTVGFYTAVGLVFILCLMFKNVTPSNHNGNRTGRTEDADLAEAVARSLQEQ